MVRSIDRWMGGSIDRWMGGWMNAWIDKNIDKYIHFFKSCGIVECSMFDVECEYMIICG